MKQNQLQDGVWVCLSVCVGMYYACVCVSVVVYR